MQSAQPVEDGLCRIALSNATNFAVKLEGLNSVEGQVHVLALGPVTCDESPFACHSESVQEITYSLFQCAASCAWNTLKSASSPFNTAVKLPGGALIAVAVMALPGSTAARSPSSRAAASFSGSGHLTAPRLVARPHNSQWTLT